MKACRDDGVGDELRRTGDSRGGGAVGVPGTPGSPRQLQIWAAKQGEGSARREEGWRRGIDRAESLTGGGGFVPGKVAAWAFKAGRPGIATRLGKETPGGFAGDLGGPSAAVARG